MYVLVKTVVLRKSLGALPSLGEGLDMCHAPSEVSFLAWFANLSNEDQCAAVEWLHEKAKELGVVVIPRGGIVTAKEALTSHDSLDIIARLFPQISLN